MMPATVAHTEGYGQVSLSHLKSGKMCAYACSKPAVQDSRAARKA
jgi:hypothetical protein